MTIFDVSSMNFWSESIPILLVVVFHAAKIGFLNLIYVIYFITMINNKNNLRGVFDCCRPEFQILSF